MSRVFGPPQLLDCYRRGVFPMADAHDDPRLFLVDPDLRGVLPLDGLHIPRSLRKTVRRDVFEIRVNTAFTRVMELCAEAAPDRPNTWINSPILNLYSMLHRMGHAHSVEAWCEGQMAGGLYGVSLQGAFFGESMFSRETDASKVALVNLVARLKRGGFVLLDTQFVTAHLQTFGVEEIAREDFHIRLRAAMQVEATFPAEPVSGHEALQLITQTS
ncbi:MAG: leucyl/phenylalanyl-tRNA--protein transferase [Rhodobacterales bacterium 12-64-8]|nr:MAG: leucyl/phenylalanyl-tRNA--protein transferase [Rhodobacterales bacterium 12-64-8]OYX49195.1 MAG: leucyl/phenylalanyl-tRNA--protein transferase [Alphaproteobacteria bacterium 32-64-14]